MCFVTFFLGLFLSPYLLPLIPPSLLLQRYHEASLIYKEVLELDSSSTEAAQELKRAQTLHIMVGEAYGQQSKLVHRLKCLFCLGSYGFRCCLKVYESFVALLSAA